MITATKLSWTAKTLLALIVERTVRDDQGNITRYWVPTDKHDFINILRDNIFIYGGSTVSSLKGLAAKGLIERPRGAARSQPYAYQSTEAGMLAFEEIRDELEAVARLNSEAREVSR